MQVERDDEERLIVRVQTTVYRRDYPELWELLQQVSPKRRGAALMAAAHQALAFERAARTMGNPNGPLQANAVAHIPPASASVQPVAAATSIATRLNSPEQQRPQTREIAPVSPDVETIASAFTADALAAFTSGPMGVS